MTDKGFKCFVQRLDSISKKIGQSTIKQTMSINFSDNFLTDQSVTVFAVLISKFNGFNYVNMSNLLKV